MTRFSLRAGRARSGAFRRGPLRSGLQTARSGRPPARSVRAGAWQSDQSATARADRPPPASIPDSVQPPAHAGTSATPAGIAIGCMQNAARRRARATAATNPPSASRRAISRKRCGAAGRTKRELSIGFTCMKLGHAATASSGPGSSFSAARSLALRARGFAATSASEGRSTLRVSTCRTPSRDNRWNCLLDEAVFQRVVRQHHPPPLRR